MATMSIHHQNSQRSFQRRTQRPQRTQWFMYWPMMLIGLILGLGIVAGLWVWQQLSDPKTLPFHEVRIQGQFQRLSASQLHNTAEQSINGGFFTLNMTAVRQSLMANPWVEDVAIRRVPGVLIIGVREQQPIARWNDQYLFNSDQQLFLTPQDAPAGLPQLRGPPDQPATVLANYQKMSALFKPLNIKINQLQLNERGSWELTLDNGILVTIGRDDVLSRVQRLAQWYSQLVKDKAADITSIDLRYQNSIAIAWKDENH